MEVRSSKMSKRLSVEEFRTYIRERHPEKITFWIDNQLWYSVFDPCKFRLSFTSVAVSENTNILVLSTPDGSELWLNRVESVEVDEKASVLGSVFRVLCASPSSPEGRLSYTLVAS